MELLFPETDAVKNITKERKLCIRDRYLSWYINDLKEAEEKGIRNFYDAIDEIIKLVLGIIVLGAINWRLLLCTLITTGMVYVLSHRFGNDVKQESEKVSAIWRCV